MDASCTLRPGEHGKGPGRELLLRGAEDKPNHPESPSQGLREWLMVRDSGDGKTLIARVLSRRASNGEYWAQSPRLAWHHRVGTTEHTPFPACPTLYCQSHQQALGPKAEKEGWE